MATPPPFVTILGSLHYDITVQGPGRPRKGETVTGVSWAPKCGGKGGNQAVAVARAGGSSVMIGAVGADDFGKTLLANLDRRGVDRQLVCVVPGAGSGMSVAIFDAEGDYGAVIVSGANLSLGAADAAAASDRLAATAILVLQNETPEAASIAAARIVRHNGGRVILNAAPARALSDDLLALVDILVVNTIEAEFLAGGPLAASLAEALAAATRLTAMVPSAIVTAGGAGVAYSDRHGLGLTLTAEPIEVRSTHGAGDEFVGTLAAALASGTAIEAALQSANHAAAVLVATPEDQRT
jgi:ribokinase